MFAAAQDHSTAGVLFLAACAFVALMQWQFKRSRYRLHIPRRRSAGRRPEDNFTTEQRAEIFENYGGRCAHCGTELHYKSECEWVNGCNHDFHADHIVPVVDGGPTTVENGQALCRYHNQKKGRRSNAECIAAGGRRR